MKRSTFFTAALLAAAVGLAGCASTPDAQGWVMLLDGSDHRTMENWDRVGDANWRIVDGAVVADKAGKPSFLVSKSSYKNFQVRAEFWADHTTNSGVLIRLSDANDITVSNSYEVNIFDGRPTHGTAAIVDVAEASPISKAGAKWNTLVVTAQGDMLMVELNGVHTVHVNDKRHASGPIALQYHPEPGGAIKFRKVQVKPL